MTIEAMKQALEALEQLQSGCTDSDDGTVEAITVWCPEVITTLRAAIEQAEKQEPVAWKWKERVNDEFDSWVITASEPPPYAIETHPLYTAPRQWQGLTDEEVSEILDREIGFNSCFGPETNFARAIEAKLKEKNA